MELIANNIEETKKIADDIASKLKKGNVILLFGDLGTGKTTFTKYVAKHLGVNTVVTSPTFTIMNEYNGHNFPIYHFDMYRVESSAEAEEFGFSEVIKSKEGICFIEWPEFCLDILPEDAIKIKITNIGETSRKFEVEGLI